MPTGYTAKLQDMEFNTEEWLTTVMPRAFGICISLRDEGLDLNEKEILKKLTEHNSTSYYEKQLTEANKDLEEMGKRTQDEWIKAFEDYKKEETNWIKEHLEKISKDREGYEKSKKKCESLLDKADGNEIATSIIQYAVSQISETIDWDCGDKTISDYQKKIQQLENGSLDDFQKEIIESIKWEIDYNNKRIEETSEIVESSLKSYKDFVGFVKENMKGIS